MGEQELRKEISDMYFRQNEEETQDAEMQDSDSSGEQREAGEGEVEERQEGQEGEVVQPTSEDEEKEETIEERYSRLMEDYNRQAQRMLDLESRVGTPPTATPPSQVPIETPTPTRAPVVPAFEISEEELEKALIEDDPKAMKKVLMGLVDYVGKIEASREDTIRERVLRDVPALANQIATEQVRLQLAITEFYNENKDLVQYRGVVGSVMNEVVAKEPNLTLAEAFDKTEKETRRRLGLKKQIQEGSKGAPTRPAFAKPSGSRKPGSPRLEGLKSEIADMIRAR